ncbi:UNVERIFIED_ORG: hypothetical protein LHK14_13335 [Roseateles sp. XES5]|nr:hypothetical protein [Roseateles sp. XES5]
MAGHREFDIGEGIKRLREVRTRFITDTPSRAYRNTQHLVDRLWPLRVAQMDPAKMHLHIYQPDPNAADQAAEQKKRVQSAMLAKLALPVWRYNLDTPTDRHSRVEELARDLALSAKDGLLPHERRSSEKIEPPISSETLRHNQSLLPKQREQLFDRGLEVPSMVEKHKGRKRTKPIDPTNALRKSLFLRSRQEWRPEEIFTACEALHAVAQWVDQQNDHDKDVLLFARRYRLDELRLSESKHAPSSFSARLAIAIASAEHMANGKDEYAADEAMAVRVSYHYGLFLRAIKSAPGKNNRGQATEFLNKLLISHNY